MEYLRSPRIPENLRFVSVEEIEELREQQRALVEQAGADALDGLGLMESFYDGSRLRNEAQQNVAAEIDQAAELYVANHLNRDDNEELFDGCVDLVRRYSVLNMSDNEWRAGVQSPTGEYDQPETSGQYRLYQELLALEETEEEPAELVPGHSDAEVAALVNTLETTRATLAELSIQRRRLARKGSKKAKNLSEQYATAEEAYNQAKIALGQLSVEALQATGMSEDEIRAEVMQGIIAERAAFTNAEVDYMQNDPSRMGRFMRKYAGSKVVRFVTNIGAGGAAGFGTGYVAGKFVKAGLVAALPGVGAALTFGLVGGARAGRALLMAQWGNAARLHNDVNERMREDFGTLHNEVNGVIGTTDTAQLAELYTNSTSKSVADRIETDVRKNRNRAIVSASVAGGAAVVGALLASGGLFPHHSPVSRGGAGGGSRSLDQILRDAGVKDAATRRDIIAHPDAFNRMVTHPKQFENFMNGVNHIKDQTGLSGAPLAERVHDTLALADHMQHADRTVEVARNVGAFSIPRGGGIIHDVIRPFAEQNGHKLTSMQESQVWQAVRGRFGDNIFVNTPVAAHGTDQWIMQSGSAQLRPEVASFMQSKIAQL